MHQKSLGHPTDRETVIHSGEEEWPELLLPDYSPKIFFGQVEEAFQLPNAVIADVAGSPGSTGLLKKPDGLLVVGFGDVKGVFKGGFVKSLVIHGTSVVPIPG
jgi:hypothetical protein